MRAIDLDHKGLLELALEAGVIGSAGQRTMACGMIGEGRKDEPQRKDGP